MQGESWKPIDIGATYGVVSNNYMRAGGDGYKIFSTNAVNAYDYGPGLEFVLADYLGKNTPYKPYTDGRITVLAPGASAEAKSSEPAAPKTPEAAKPATKQRQRLQRPTTILIPIRSSAETISGILPKRSTAKAASGRNSPKPIPT